ncbi:MAG: proton-conducting transporter membrane subunit, partial [Candidatus ainarchaeum sp.]|nr:proton-conducting transporter membrane subunit [Candidatus ainarchaeum sp.]
GAMFGLVFSDGLAWIYFFWEVTTVCSFILIGYAGTREAVDSAFLALTLNLVGSLGFALAMLYLASSGGPDTLSGLGAMGKAAALLPAALIAVAALAKSAQMPFSSWLVEATVAPTPVSALLHSATMVNAGVYVLLRLAPVFSGSVSGAMLSLIGGVTFVLASGMAVSQSDAKKVLAYSTVSNLGIIVACAGIGTYEAVWAAILLLLFHALAKSLMFLSVGTVEHRIGSRDIDDMEGLATRMPRTAFIMLVGIAAMFLAPFGMLISKWAVLRAFIDASPVLVGILALGSGITVFFWAKWMGKLVADTRTHKIMEERIGAGEWAALSGLTALSLGMCLLFPSVSHYVVEPFVLAAYGNSMHLAQDNVAIMLLMLAAILMVPFSMLYYGRKRRHLPPYMCGVPTVGGAHFEGSMGVERELSLKNYRLEEMFGERKLARIGAALCVLLIAGMLLFSFGVKG